MYRIILLGIRWIAKSVILPVIFRILSPINKALDRVLKNIVSTGVIRSSKKYNTIEVLINKLLRGGENGVRAYKYAEITNDLFRPSTPISKGPHVKFLKQYIDIKDDIFHPDIFVETPYYKNASQTISLCGSYFYNETSKIIDTAKKFIKQYNNENISKLPRQPGESPKGTPILVRKIKHSSFYEVIDGNHRLAIALMKGEESTEIQLIDEKEVYTPLQRLLLDVMWVDNKRWLYQPIHSPEINESWSLIRKCTDRLEKICTILKEKELLPPKTKSYLDIGSNYGWFVSKLEGAGFESYGLERDSIAISVGTQVYGLKNEQIICGDIINYLRTTTKNFDVVSFLSVLHHFKLSQDSITAEEVIKLVDSITNKVLFFETGQSHEEAFNGRLSKWTNDYIINWLKENTTFKHFINLGQDDDCIPPFEKYYNRTLFACLR